MDANFGVLIGLGLSNFGSVKFFGDPICQQTVIPFLSSEKERERQAAALCLAMLCYKNEANAQEIIDYLFTFSASNPSQFSASVEYYTTFAVGLAYFQTNNVDQC